MANEKFLSQVTLPELGTYKFKDADAREAIAALESYTDYLGVTTTELSDGASTNPITINGESVTAKTGNITNYGSKEFIFNGSVWQEFGDLTGLGDLAFKDSASGDYTPAGTITNTPTTATVNSITNAGTLPTVDPETTTVQSVTDVGTLPVVSPTTDTVYSITDVGTLPTVSPQTASIQPVDSLGTLPSFTVNEETETLIFSAGALPTLGTAQTVVTDVGYTAGTLPTKGAAQTVVSDVGYTAGTLPTLGAAQTVVTDVGYTQGTLPTIGADQTVLTGVASTFAGTTDTITVE